MPLIVQSAPTKRAKHVAPSGAVPVVYRIPFNGSTPLNQGIYDNDGALAATMDAFVASYDDGTLDGPDNGTNHLQRAAHTSGGYADRGYLSLQWWNTTTDIVFGHTKSCGVVSGYGTESQPKYGRFRVRWTTVPSSGEEGKFAFMSAGAGASGDRMLIQFGNGSSGIAGYPGGGGADQALLVFAQNISTNRTYLLLDANTWYHIQFAYLHGLADDCYIKVWANNNTFASPTRAFGPAQFNDDWTQGDHYTAGAQMWWGGAQGALSGTADWAFDIQEAEFGLEFDPNWYPG